MDIWSKDKPLNLEKIAEHFKEKCVFGPVDLQRMAMQKAHGVVLEKKASFQRLCNALVPGSMEKVAYETLGEKTDQIGQDAKKVQAAEVIPSVPPNAMSTKTVASADPGSNMPGTSGQQQKIASLGKFAAGTAVAALPPQPRTHVVARGDNLTKISERYKCGLQELMDANKLKNGNIRVGQTLTIPQRAPEPPFDPARYNAFQRRLLRTPEHRIGELVDAVADANPDTETVIAH